MSTQQEYSIKETLSGELQKIQTSSTSKFTDRQLLQMDFSKLPERQLLLLDKLSFFSGHRSMLRVLVSQYGESKAKQRYIKDNISFLTAGETVAFSKNQDYFFNRTFVVPAYIISFCTASCFISALWKLPSRMSTVKYTLIGLATGIITSYAYWKYSMLSYYQQLNKLFRIVTLSRYESEITKK